MQMVTIWTHHVVVFERHMKAVLQVLAAQIIRPLGTLLVLNIYKNKVWLFGKGELSTITHMCG
jgi:hypothetical protein